METSSVMLISPSMFWKVCEKDAISLPIFSSVSSFVLPSLIRKISTFFPMHFSRNASTFFLSFFILSISGTGVSFSPYSSFASWHKNSQLDPSVPIRKARSNPSFRSSLSAARKGYLLASTLSISTEYPHPSCPALASRTAYNVLLYLWPDLFFPPAPTTATKISFAFFIFFLLS